jgi:hypothetical protein
MSPRNAEPSERQCACGSALLFESREAAGTTRSLALCSNPDCGLITTSQDDCDEQDLRSFLLGNRPVRRELKPWTRFWFKATSTGHRCTSAPEPCTQCGDESTGALELRWNPQRFQDPFIVILCSRCGATTLSYFIDGERLKTSLTGDAWLEPAPPIILLKRALSERAQLAAGYEPWDFE